MEKKLKKGKSESLLFGALFALSGGFMDAYSYIFRDHVFANGQTGNILLLGVNLVEGHFAEAIHYIYPIVGFILGVIIGAVLRILDKKYKHVFRQIGFIVEALVLVGVAFIPTSLNWLANALTSLACAIQLTLYRKVQGVALATTMCVANLKNAVENVTLAVAKKDKSYLSIAFVHAFIILAFVVGAIICSSLIPLTGIWTITICAAPLLIAFALSFTKFDDYE